MRSVRTCAAILAAGLAACGGQTESPTPSATPLAYSIPAVNPVTYAASDTALINIEIQPGMPMEQTMGQSSRVQLTYAPTVGTDGNLTVTAEYLDFSAFAASAMGGRQEVDGEGLQGEFVLSVTPVGKTDQVSGPELPDAVEQLTMGGENLFADFFVRLPGTMVEPGATWTDTIISRSDEEGTVTENETIVVSTFVGDTMVAGRTYWVIDATKSSHVLVEGNMQGMDMRNELSGTINETSLWDPELRVLQSSTATGSMSGTLDIPSAGMTGIPLEATNTRRIMRVEAGS